MRRNAYRKNSDGEVLPMLEISHVTFRYGKTGPDVLKNISISMGQGEFIALSGRNGSGKTTVTRIFTGLEKPFSGKVLYQGKDITHLGAAERSRFIGYVFQQPERQMFRPTVREEIAFGPYQKGRRGKELDDVVSRAMEDTDLTGLGDMYPHTLSRGDKQRVAIASALAMESQFLILDEPTSGQDGSEKKKLMHLLSRLNQQGITILLITHDMDIVAHFCRRAVVIAHGTVAFDGTPKELFTEYQELEKTGLVRPASVTLGMELPGSPYCPDMETFRHAFLEAGRKS